MGNLFMRKYEFACGGIFTDPLTVQFRVPFSDSADSNDAEVKVYNLKDTTVNSLKTKAVALLSAGYVDDYGVIFNGFLKDVKTEWQGVDKITTFICIDGTIDYLDKDFKKTYAKNTAASTIIREIAAFAGLKIGEIALPVNFVYRTGKNVNGKPKALLTAIAKDCKAKMHVTQGRLYMRKKDVGTNLTLNISKETGLIDQPEAISNEVEEPGAKQKKTRKGYKLRMLLNPRITTDVTIKLTSAKVSGLFRVESGEHKGDTSGNEWYTECEVYPA